MNRKRVASSNLASVGFDLDQNILEIEFMNGHVYQYFGVPETVFLNLVEAESKGQFFNQFIRDRYAFEQKV